MSEDTSKKWDDSLISMGLGALVVVVSGILLFNYFNNQTPKLLKDQAQKSIAVSSTMPKVENSSPTATSSGKIATKITIPSPVITVAPKVTASAKPTATPKATVAPSAAPTQTPKATTAPQIAQASTAPVTDSKTLPTTYTVQTGDSLWGLSEKFYGTGYEWKRIATANNMTGGYGISTGQTLNVPKVELISATATDKTQVAQAPVASQATKASVSPTPAHSATTVSPSSSNAAAAPAQGTITYTVVHGDTLWSIAQSQCHNGYAWSSISQQNKLSHPGVIHAGNTFTFTCQ